jgi:hypothetical protein
MLTIVSGVVVKGYRVASGPSKDYPYGTLEKQIPLFKAAGLDLEKFYPATLNISISPYAFEMDQPAITIRHVCWTDLHPPEDFSFSRCTLRYKGAKVQGYIYYPHPETKQRHFESASILEIITVHIPGIHYGDQVELELDPDELRVWVETK